MKSRVYLGHAVLAGVALTVCGCSSSADTSHEPVASVTQALGPAQKVGVPAYYWWTASDWNGVTAQNSVGLAILNPNNGLLGGVSESSIAGFQSKVSALQAQTPRPLVFGYVYTRYANTDPNNSDGGVHNRDVATVEANIDLYYQKFPTIDGIFLDEATTQCDYRLSYYQQIYQWLQVHHPGAKLAINPGTTSTASECYLTPTKAADIIVSFEGTYDDYKKCSARPQWEQNYLSDTFWHMVYSTPTSQLDNALALSRTRNAGWVYVTDQSGWTTIASNIAAEGSNVAQFGATYSAVHHFSAEKLSDRYAFSSVFDEAFAYKQVYIDSTSGGYSIGGIGADYLIENSGFRSYVGPGFTWSSAATANQTASGNTRTWWVPLGSIATSGSPISVVFRGGNTPSVTAPVCSIP